MISRLALLGGICLLTMGAQFSCSSGDSNDDRGPGNDQFDVELVLLATNGAERTQFTFGSNIVFELVVRNRSGASQTLTLPTNQVFEFAVFEPGAASPRWRWSTNQAFSPVQSTYTYGPRQSLTYPYVWQGVLDDGTQLMPGTYEFRGTLAYPQYDANWRGNNNLSARARTITITN